VLTVNSAELFHLALVALMQWWWRSFFKIHSSEGCTILWWCICFSDCSHNAKTTCPNFTNFYAYCLSQWLGPVLMVLWYIMCFQFCELCHGASFHRAIGLESSTALCFEEVCHVQYQFDVRQVQSLSEYGTGGKVFYVWLTSFIHAHVALDTSAHHKCP